MARKKTVVKAEKRAKSKRPGIAGKGNPKTAKAVPEEVLIADQPRLVEALAPAKEPEWVKAGEVPASVDQPLPTEKTSPPPKKRRKSQGEKGDKSAAHKPVAQLQSEAFDPHAVKAAFSETPSQMLHNAGLKLNVLSPPVLEVADTVISRLAEFQASLGDKPGDKAPSWLDHLDIIGDSFEDIAVKMQAWGKVSTLTKKQGDKDPLKSLKDALIMAMELAGAVGKDNPGLAVGPARAKHVTGEDVRVDIEGVMTYLLERGVNAQLLDDARKANTTTTPFAYVAFYRNVDQRGMNLAAHQEEGDSTEGDR